MRTFTAAAIFVGTMCAPGIARGTPYTVHRIPRGPHHLYAREYPGTEPAIVLMHGFPDDLHLYDRLVPELRGRRRILFDFLGWGRSDKPADHAYTFRSLQDDLDAVITYFAVADPVLVAHDASGPPAINWALDHPDRVGALVLLNTFYNLTPTLRPPEAIAIFSDLLELKGAELVGPVAPFDFSRLADAIRGNAAVARWLYTWQVGGFIRDDHERRIFVRKLFRPFAKARGLRGFLGLNRDLLGAIITDTVRAPELRSFARPVRIVFGADDPYLNPGVAESFHAALPTSDLFLIPTARHYVQVDEPAEVARLIRSVGMPAHDSGAATLGANAPRF